MKKTKQNKCKVPVQREVRTWWEDLPLTSLTTRSSKRTSPKRQGWCKQEFLETAESLANHWLGRQKLDLGRNQVCFRICTSSMLLLLCGHNCHPIRVHLLIFLLWEPCLKSASHLVLPLGWTQVLGPHFPLANHQFIHSSNFLSPNTGVLRSKCYSGNAEFFKTISFLSADMQNKTFACPVFPLKHVAFFYWGVCFQGINFFSNLIQLFVPSSLFFWSGDLLPNLSSTVFVL